MVFVSPLPYEYDGKLANIGCFKIHHDHNIRALNKGLHFFLFSHHFPSTVMVSHPRWGTCTCNSLVNTTAVIQRQQILIIQGKLGIFCQTFGSTQRPSPFRTPKITPQQEKASPQCETVPRLLCKSKSFPFHLSFRAPESPHIPLPWLCGAALLAGLMPVNTSDSQTPEGL